MYLSVKNIKQIKEAEIEGDKIVLYGPNGGGKSTLIHLALLVLDRISSSDIRHTAGTLIYYDHVINKRAFREDSSALLRFQTAGREYTIEVRGTKMMVDNAEYELFADRSEKIADVSLWHIDEGRAQYVGTRLCDFAPIHIEENFAASVKCPQLAEKLYVPHEGGFGRVYYDMAQSGGSWISTRELSYGQRRFLAILAALHSGDFVFVENFEAGLHVDFMVELLEVAARTENTVVLETHSAFVVRRAPELGFRVYKVEGGTAKFVHDPKDVELFRREIQYLRLT
ncbi:AAA family ATPase [Pyrobaculum sp.]|uniref:AAA family ATPase n=1 Tax=Pyrobaculum sp. TaxID=2004705 RepID=UPI00317CA4CA